MRRKYPPNSGPPAECAAKCAFRWQERTVNSNSCRCRDLREGAGAGLVRSLTLGRGGKCSLTVTVETPFSYSSSLLPPRQGIGENPACPGAHSQAGQLGPRVPSFTLRRAQTPENPRNAAQNVSSPPRRFRGPAGTSFLIGERCLGLTLVQVAVKTGIVSLMLERGHHGSKDSKMQSS